MNNPNVITLVEIHMGRNQDLAMTSTLRYSGLTQVNVIGFNDDIWIY